MPVPSGLAFYLTVQPLGSDFLSLILDDEYAEVNIVRWNLNGEAKILASLGVLMFQPSFVVIPCRKREQCSLVRLHLRLLEQRRLALYLYDRLRLVHLVRL